MTSWFHRELSLGDRGDDVVVVQRRLKMVATGVYDRDTEARVRAVQRSNALPITGAVDQVTADAIGERERFGLVPDWYSDPLTAEAVGELRWLLGFPRAGELDSEVADALRRFQSQNRIPPTGIVSEETAIMLGEDVPVST